MDRWPIAHALYEGRTYLGIPQQFEASSAAGGVAPQSLEERAGEHWSADLLSCLMPRDRAWAWWTRSRVFTESQLGAARGSRSFDTRTERKTVCRKLWSRQMTLCIVPARHDDAQQTVLEWAGLDTEQVPDHLWTSPDEPRDWDLDQLQAWCSDPRRWRHGASVASQPAERILTLFGGYVFCAVEREAGSLVRHRLSMLAARWSLYIVPGPRENAWVIAPPGAD